MTHKILVVNQDSDIANDLRNNLREAGIEVLAARGVSAALTKAQAEKPSVILLDLTLPSELGLQLCHLLKSGKYTGLIPVVILAPEATEESRIIALEAGADDFVTQPFSYRQIVLRLKNSIGRTSMKELAPEAITVGEMQLDLARHEFAIQNRVVNLTHTEFKLMTRLMEKPGQVLVRDRLLDSVWGMNNATLTRTIDTTVARLRHKLGPTAQRLETVRGVGYRLNKEILSHNQERNEETLRLPRVNLPLAKKRHGKTVPSTANHRSQELAIA